MRYLVPLHDSIEGFITAWIYRKYNCCYVTVRTSQEPKKMQRLKDIAYLLHQANQSNNFHFINLSDELDVINKKLYNNDFQLFNQMKMGNMAFELENAAYVNLARESKRQLVQPYSEIDYLLNDRFFDGDVFPLAELSKDQLYKDAQLFGFPKELIAAYREMDLQKLNEVTDLTYGDINWALNEIKSDITSNLLNSMYTDKQKEALKFIKLNM